MAANNSGNKPAGGGCFGTVGGLLGLCLVLTWGAGLAR